MSKPIVQIQLESTGRRAPTYAQTQAWVKGHRGYKNIPRLPFAMRFWSYVEIRSQGECWPWHGFRNKQGYGLTSFPPGKPVNASHIAWILTAKRDLPPGLFVCHHCDNPPCVNPSHLFSGTRDDNTQDMLRKGRQCKGERSAQAKLTYAKAEEIRAKYPARNQYQLAEDYGVSQYAIWAILAGRGWIR